MARASYIDLASQPVTTRLNACVQVRKPDTPKAMVKKSKESTPCPMTVDEMVRTQRNRPCVRALRITITPALTNSPVM